MTAERLACWGTKAAGSETAVVVWSACSGATTLAPGARSSSSEAPHVCCSASETSGEDKKDSSPHCSKSERTTAGGPRRDFQRL